METSLPVPVADLYFGCISTMCWALVLAIPVINFNTYRYGCGDFSLAKGSTEVTDIDRFIADLDALLTPGAVDDLKAAASADSDN